MAGLPDNQRRMIGREEAQAQLRDCLDRLMAGAGQLVLISGEAGIGKTTLVNDLVQHARQTDARVLTGGCYDLTTNPPYGPWLEALASYQPDAARTTAPPLLDDRDAAGQSELFEQARQFLSSAAPAVVVVEDLHWSDPASLELLRYLARHTERDGVLLLVTYREDELTRHDELYLLLPLLIRESRVMRLHLNRLTEPDIRLLITQRYPLEKEVANRLGDYIWERSAGNPFYATELLNSLEDDRVIRPAGSVWDVGDLQQAHVPVLLRQLIEGRLARLPRETQLALQSAAVIGQEIPLSLWQTVAGLDGDELAQVITGAIASRLLEEAPGGSRVRFPHALTREAIYTDIPYSRRIRYHLRAGELLVASAAPDPDQVADHFRQARDPRAVEWLIKAGNRAEERYAQPAAGARYEAALDLIEADPEASLLRARLLFQVGKMFQIVDKEKSLKFHAEGIRLAREIDEPYLAALCLSIHGWVRYSRNEIRAGLVEREEAVSIERAVPPDEQERVRQALLALFPGTLIPRITPTYMLSLTQIGRFREVIELGGSFETLPVDDGLAPVAGTDYPGPVCQSLADTHDGLGIPELASAWRKLAIQIYAAAGGHIQLTFQYQMVLDHLLSWHTDRVAARRRTASLIQAESIHMTRAWEADFPEAIHFVPLDVLEGRWLEAREAALYSYEVYHPMAHVLKRMRLRALGVAGREQGDPDLAWRQVNENLPDGLETEPGDCPFFEALMAQRLAANLALDAGGLDQARRWLEMNDRWLDWSGAVPGRAENRLGWSRYHRLAGDLELARQEAERALELASNPRQPLALIAADRILGELAIDEGSPDAAADHLCRSLELADACEAPIEIARTKLVMAKLAARNGESDRARALIAEVRAICTPLQARLALTEADEIDAALPLATGTNPAGLTNREVEVLELVTDGLTNASIAEQLFISPRTVAQHLRSVYNKLGVNSRAAAVARWADLTRN